MLAMGFKIESEVVIFRSSVGVYKSPTRLWKTVPYPPKLGM